MPIKLNLIAAACENMGIGKDNNLPWRLKSEMEYFTRMTQTTKDTNKKNVVIMGRRTWDSIPPKFKPLDGRINYVLSRNELDLSDYKDTYSFKSLESTMEHLKIEQVASEIERVWVIGGGHIYKESMESPNFYRLYLTKILKQFDCDTFMPALKSNLIETSDPDVPQGTQTEKGINFVYTVLENPDFSS